MGTFAGKQPGQKRRQLRSHTHFLPGKDRRKPRPASRRRRQVIDAIPMGNPAGSRHDHSSSARTSPVPFVFIPSGSLPWRSSNHGQRLRQAGIKLIRPKDVVPDSKLQIGRRRDRYDGDELYSSDLDKPPTRRSSRRGMGLWSRIIPISDRPTPGMRSTPCSTPSINGKLTPIRSSTIKHGKRRARAARSASIRGARHRE